MDINNYKNLLDKANKEIDNVYDRLYKAQDEIKELKSIINNRPFEIYAVLIADECSYHRLIEKSKNELVCIDCGRTYHVKEEITL